MFSFGEVIAEFDLKLPEISVSVFGSTGDLGDSKSSCTKAELPIVEAAAAQRRRLGIYGTGCLRSQSLTAVVRIRIRIWVFGVESCGNRGPFHYDHDDFLLLILPVAATIRAIRTGYH